MCRAAVEAVEAFEEMGAAKTGCFALRPIHKAIEDQRVVFSEKV